jgi:GR25 family glycosyltransferase involved in LPS biosynthesis
VETFQNHKAILPGIDDAHVINLDRRGDRLKSFSEAHPSLAGLVKRHAAHDGRSLKLTKGLAELFKPNDFFWKKAVMGCALSHLDLWSALSNESIDINSYLILEDDARLDPSWKDAWNKAYPSLPADWDCVYLGGILPPNRSTFTQTLERIAPGLARVAPNQIFGQPMKTRYFHFCAYAYVLSKRGANKILNTIKERGGYWTSADHMVCNRVDSMNLYVLDPLVAGASQDNDPAYQTAQFNNFSRIDKFDSDLWNNDERFTVDEIKAFLEPAVPMKSAGPRFICLNTSMENGSKLYEANWLQDIFQFKNFNIESVSATETLSITDDLIVVLIKPQWAEQLAWLEALRGSGRRFKILHLSDEFGSDPIHMYSWAEVKGVMRFYQRADLPADPKIMVIPLGYHWQFRGNRDVPHLSTPNLPFRDNMWSFAGTDWKGRSRDMAILQAIQPHYLKWFAEWRDPAQLKDEEYISLMLNTKFVPCPRGQNVETYRFYEALECGCVPLFVDMPENEAWLKPLIRDSLLKTTGVEHAAGIMDYFSKNVEQMEQYRMAILISWAKYKAELKERVRVWLGK